MKDPALFRYKIKLNDAKTLLLQAISIYYVLSQKTLSGFCFQTIKTTFKLKLKSY